MSFAAAYWASQIPAAGVVSDAALRTLTVIALHADEPDGDAYPGLKRLCAERGVQPNAIKRHLRHLEQAGLIARIPDSPKAAKYPEHVRPIVWRVALDYFEGVSPGDTPRGYHPVTPEGYHPVNPGEVSPAGKSVIDLETSDSQEETLQSAAQRDLGGFRDDDAPAMSRERRFPRQCDKHQSRLNAGEHFEPCLGCKAVVGQLEAEAKADEVRAQAQADAEAARIAQNRRRITKCDDCDDDGWVDAEWPARRCTHPNVPQAVAS